MSIKSTYDIERDTAIQVLMTRIYAMDNNTLANLLEEMPESHFRNYIVHDELDYNEMDEWEQDKCIKNAMQF